MDGFSGNITRKSFDMVEVCGGWVLTDGSTPNCFWLRGWAVLAAFKSWWPAHALTSTLWAMNVTRNVFVPVTNAPATTHTHGRGLLRRVRSTQRNQGRMPRNFPPRTGGQTRRPPRRSVHEFGRRRGQTRRSQNPRASEVNRGSRLPRGGSHRFPQRLAIL